MAIHPTRTIVHDRRSVTATGSRAQCAARARAVRILDRRRGKRRRQTEVFRALIHRISRALHCHVEPGHTRSQRHAATGHRQRASRHICRIGVHHIRRVVVTHFRRAMRQSQINHRARFQRLVHAHREHRIAALRHIVHTRHTQHRTVIVHTRAVIIAVRGRPIVLDRTRPNVRVRHIRLRHVRRQRERLRTFIHRIIDRRHFDRQRHHPRRDRVLAIHWRQHHVVRAVVVRHHQTRRINVPRLRRQRIGHRGEEFNVQCDRRGFAQAHCEHCLGAFFHRHIVDAQHRTVIVQGSTRTVRYAFRQGTIVPTARTVIHNVSRLRVRDRRVGTVGGNQRKILGSFVGIV